MSTWSEDRAKVEQWQPEFPGEFTLRRPGSSSTDRYAVDFQKSFVDSAGVVQLVVYNVETHNDLCRCTPVELLRYAGRPTTSSGPPPEPGDPWRGPCRRHIGSNRRKPWMEFACWYDYGRQAWVVRDVSGPVIETCTHAQRLEHCYACQHGGEPAERRSGRERRGGALGPDTVTCSRCGATAGARSAELNDGCAVCAPSDEPDMIECFVCRRPIPEAEAEPVEGGQDGPRLFCAACYDLERKARRGGAR